MGRGNDSSQLLADVIQSIEDGAAIYDTNDRLVQFNDKYTQYFLLVHDLLKPGITFREIFEAQADRGLIEGSEAEKQAWVNSRVKLFDDGARANEFQRVDGSWVRIDYYKLPGGGTFVVTADITQRKAGEAALQQSKDRLEHAVAARTADLQAALDSLSKAQTRLGDAIDSIEEGFVYYDADERLILCNKKYREFYPWIDDVLVPGARLEDVARAAAERGQDATPIADVGKWVDERRAAFASGEMYEQHLRDGRWLSCRESRTRDGGFVGLSIDISAQKLAEASLRESEAQLRLVADGLPARISYLDKEKRYRFVNRQYTDAIGRPSSEIIGKTIRDVRGVEFDASITDYLDKTFSGEQVTYDVRAVGPDGETRDLNVTMVPHRDAEGAVQGYFVLSNDITERKRAEDASKEANERFSRAFSSNPTAVAIADLDGKLFDVNNKLTETFGYSREEAIGKKAVDLGIWADAKDRDKAVAAQTADGLLENFEVTFRARDGRVIHGLHSSESIEIDGRPMRLGITNDITDRKDAEEALKEREELFVRVFESSPALIAISQPKDGAHFDVNKAWIETTGYSHDEAMANSAEKLGIWAEQEMRDRFVALLEQQGSVRNYEAKFRAKDGREIDVLVGGEYMDFDAGPRLLVAAHDITERKQVERALRESEGRFKSMIENSPSAINLKDLDGRYRVTNSKFEDWSHLSGTDLIGLTPRDLFPEGGEFVEVAAKLDKEVLANNTSREHEMSVVFRDGSVRWLHIMKFPVRDANGATVGVGTINTDITERREAEERLRQAQRWRPSDNSPAVSPTTSTICSQSSWAMPNFSGSVTMTTNRGWRRSTGLPHAGPN